MASRRTSALLWGAVGLLSFLVLHQAYLLTGGRFIGVAPVAGVAAVVFAVTAVVTYYTEGRLGLLEGEAPPVGEPATGGSETAEFDDGEPREQPDAASTEGPTADSEPSTAADDGEPETGEDGWIWGG